MCKDWLDHSFVKQIHRSTAQMKTARWEQLPYRNYFPKRSRFEAFFTWTLNKIDKISKLLQILCMEVFSGEFFRAKEKSYEDFL